MAASSSSSSSFTSSSLGGHQSYGGRTYVSPYDSAWTTPSSAASGVSALSSLDSAPPSNLAPLDLGPPGYEATITLYENTSNERTIYLGPWEIVGSQDRRVLWQCTYQNELLEHFLPPYDIFPHTLHARHRPYTDPSDLELYITFREAHRIRYTTEDGVVVHDQFIQVKYEFTSMESAAHFQGDVRRKTFLDFYDVDVFWSDVHGRTDRFGNVRGMGLVQRMKMWRDNYSNLHSISIFANRSGRMYQEYEIHAFDAELRSRDDRAKQIRISVRGGTSRRGSAGDSVRRFTSIRDRIRPRQRSVGHGNHESPDQAYAQSPYEFRYLGIQFSKREDFRRFLEAWSEAHAADSEFHGIPFPANHFELPSPQILAGDASELDHGDYYGPLQSVPEPDEYRASTP